MTDTGAEASSVFWEIHSGNTQEGPGNFESTKRAFSFLTGLPPAPSILNIGCGPGRETLELGRISSGTIVALDSHLPFITGLRSKAEIPGLADRISGVCADMRQLPLCGECVDVIWSEGAIYNIGFENGLREWRKILKPGGYVAASELSWFRSDAPAVLREFWGEGYPAMQDVAGNLELIQQAGYQLTGHFSLPERAWWAYYQPIERRLGLLREKYHDMPAALAVVELEQKEIDLYRGYAEYYGYEFYIAQSV